MRVVGLDLSPPLPDSKAHPCVPLSPLLPPKTQIPPGVAGTDRRSKNNPPEALTVVAAWHPASEDRQEFSLNLKGLLLDQQSQPGRRRKALGAKKSLLRSSHFLLRFPLFPLMHRLGKVAKEAGPGDLSPVGGGGGVEWKS